MSDEGETVCPYGSGPHRAKGEILASRFWSMRIEQTTMRVHVVAVLISGAIGDYAVYMGAALLTGELDDADLAAHREFSEWVRGSGNKLLFEDALQLFPGLVEGVYRP